MRNGEPVKKVSNGKKRDPVRSTLAKHKVKPHDGAQNAPFAFHTGSSTSLQTQKVRNQTGGKNPQQPKQKLHGKATNKLDGGDDQ